MFLENGGFTCCADGEGAIFLVDSDQRTGGIEADSADLARVPVLRNSLQTPQAFDLYDTLRKLLQSETGKITRVLSLLIVKAGRSRFRFEGTAQTVIIYSGSLMSLINSIIAERNQKNEPK